MYKMIVVILVAILAVSTLPCQGGLLTNVQFNRQVAVYPDATINCSPTVSDHFVGTSLPAVGSLTATAENDATVTATYDFTDDGKTADFDIKTQSTLPGEGLAEEGGGGGGITIWTSQTTQYTVNMQIGTYCQAYMDFWLDNSVGDQICSLQSSTVTGEDLPRLSTTGVLAPGRYVIVDYNEQLVNPDDNTYYIGSASFDFSLTAIPEPSSGYLLVSGVFAIVSTGAFKRIRGRRQTT